MEVDGGCPKENRRFVEVSTFLANILDTFAVFHQPEHWISLSSCVTGNSHFMPRFGGKLCTEGFKAHGLLPKVSKGVERCSQELVADGETTETTGVASQDVLGVPWWVLGSWKSQLLIVFECV